MLNKLFAKLHDRDDQKKKIFAPVKGRVMPITQSADLAHQEEAVGKGVCFMPQGGKVFSPVDGIEVLVHCGIDTVKLGGQGFKAYVEEGAAVKTGDLILEYDQDIITRAGYSLETQLVITNTGDYKAITQAKSGDCNPGDVVLYVE